MVWHIGDLCVAKSSTFDGELYNAKIIKLLPNDSKAQVSFIEYGDIEEVLLTDLKRFGEFAINKAGDLVSGDSQRSSKLRWPGGWKEGDACLSWWDGDKSWSNAKIIKIFSPEEVLVYFTDDEHENADFTSLNLLKALEGAGEVKMKEDCKDKKLEPKSSGHIVDPKAKMSLWSVGDLCVAMWTEDSVWYRSKIIEIDGDRVLVEFIEYGNKDYTTIGELKPKDALDEEEKKEDTVVEKDKDHAWKTGDVCVARWVEDGVWYRSKILEIDGDRVLVEFIQYGNQDYTTIGELKPKDALDEKEEKEARDKEKVKSWKIGDLCVVKSSQFDGFYNGQILKIGNNAAMVEFIEYARQEEIDFEDLQPFGPSAVNKNGELVKHKPAVTSPSEWKDGDLCVSPWETDNNLYNAKILKIFNKDEVLVQFVDHGNADFTCLANLKPAGSSLKNIEVSNMDIKKVGEVSEKKLADSSLKNTEDSKSRKVGDMPENMKVSNSSEKKKDVEMSVKKVEQVPKNMKAGMSSKNESRKSANSEALVYENKTDSNKKKEEKVQSANLEKEEAGKWTSKSLRKPMTASMEKPRPLFKPDRNVEPKIVEPSPSRPLSKPDRNVEPKIVQPSRGQSAGSAVKTSLSQIDLSPIISQKVKIGACPSTPKHDDHQFNQMKKAATVMSDNSNKATITVPDTFNMATVTSHLEAITLPGISNLDMEASPDISNMAAVSLTTSGSRYLQSIIPDMTPQYVNKLQDELLKTPLAVMNHPTATFVIQKLLEVCSSSHLELYVSTVEEHFLSLSLHPAGCRVVQKCLAVASTDQKEKIGLMLENYRTLIRLLRNKNGTYVAQALLPTLPVRTTTFIVNSLLGHMVDIGRNPHGTYFIQKLVTGKAQGQVSVQLLIEEIVKNVGYLAHDELGTRLLQEVLASSSSPQVISGLSQWVTNNMTAVFKSSPAVFLAKAVIQKLSGVSHGQVCLELLEEMVTSSMETTVDGKPLLIAASLHPVGHGLAKEIVAQVNIVPSRNKLLATINKFSLPLKQDPFGCLVLKALEGRI